MNIPILFSCCSEVRQARRAKRNEIVSFVPQLSALDLGPTVCSAHSFLWLNRELIFISMVLRLMASGLEAGDAGYQAYEVHADQPTTTCHNKVV